MKNNPSAHAHAAAAAAAASLLLLLLPALPPCAPLPHWARSLLRSLAGTVGVQLREEGTGCWEAKPDFSSLWALIGRQATVNPLCAV